jgi:fatty-acyl-CoA synthase
MQMHLGDWLGRRAQLSPNKIALYDAQRQMQPISYRSWNENANRTAHLLRGLGVKAGDRVAVLSYNCIEFLDIWFACGKLGAIMQPLNWRLTTAEHTALLADATPIVSIYGPEFVETIREIRQQPTSSATWIALDDDTLACAEDHRLSERDSCSTSMDPIELNPDTGWVICYTGGTTGIPKGAILTHANIAANAINTVMSWGLDANDIAVLNAPLFHTGGLNVFTAPLVMAGGTSIVCKAFDADQTFDLIRDRGVTLFFGVPTMFVALQQHPRWDTADFSKLKLVISGGAPCPLPIFEEFWRRGIDFKTGYGLTEAGPNTFWLPPEDVKRKPGSVGFPLWYIDVKIVDGQGRSCPPDTVGELLIRGPHVCAGYWHRPEETARTIIDGWLHTGDLAKCDREGYYTIVGRLKDVIISGGENIYPAEVESVLAQYEGVAEAALIGVADAKWGEVGWAVVVPRPEHRIDPDQLLAFVRERLARYKLPRHVIIAESLPKTAAGKIDKRTLVQTYA